MGKIILSFEEKEIVNQILFEKENLDSKEDLIKSLKESNIVSEEFLSILGELNEKDFLKIKKENFPLEENIIYTF